VGPADALPSFHWFFFSLFHPELLERRLLFLSCSPLSFCFVLVPPLCGHFYGPIADLVTYFRTAFTLASYGYAGFQLPPLIYLIRGPPFNAARPFFGFRPRFAVLIPQMPIRFMVGIPPIFCSVCVVLFSNRFSRHKARFGRLFLLGFHSSFFWR